MRLTISADETNNAIVVFGTGRDYAVVEEALRKLDILPYQVLIEAAITEVSLTDNLRYGVQWNFQAGETNFALGEGETASPVRAFPGFSFFYSNNNDISATLNALEKRTNIKVISAPKLLVLNNQTAVLQVGDQVPITTQSATSVVTSNAAIVNSVEYRDTGVILKVTPRVNASGLVLLDIAQEVSDVQTNQTSKIDSPTISTRRIATSIAAQDGQVIALGGMFRNSQSFGKNGLPLLSRIPILGGLLFGSNNNQTNRTELLVILKAHVLRSIDDGRAVTEELRAKLRTLEPFKTQGTMP
jgi:general secretion pathway protein D